MVSPPQDVGRGRVDGPPGGIGAAIFAFLSGVVLATIAGSIVIALGGGTTSAAANAATFIGEWIGFVGVPVWLSHQRGTGRLSRDFGLRLGGPGDIGLGLAGGFGAFAAVAVYSAILSQFDHANLGHEAQQLSGHGLGVGFVVFALCAGIGAPIAEELFFRGLVQPALQRRIGGIAGLAVTAVVFGLVHLGANPIEAIPPLIFFGFIVGTMAWRTGRLGPGIVAHITFNGITVVVLALSR